MTFQRSFAVLLLAVLALVVYALAEGLPNDHQVTGVAWYTLVVLGKISSMLGMGNTMIGAVIVVMGYVVFVGFYGLWVLSAPQPAYTESYATMMSRYPTAPLAVKIAVPLVYLLGGIAFIGIAYFGFGWTFS